MKFFTAFIGFFALASLVASQENKESIVATLVPIKTDKEKQQLEICEAETKADNGQTFAAIRYGYDGVPFTVKYGHCVPVRELSNNTVVATTVFCKSATCTLYKDRECHGVATQVSILFPTVEGNIPIDFPVVADFAELLGASASCTPNII